VQAMVEAGRVAVWLSRCKAVLSLFIHRSSREERGKSDALSWKPFSNLISTSATRLVLTCCCSYTLVHPLRLTTASAHPTPATARPRSCHFRRPSPPPFPPPRPTPQASHHAPQERKVQGGQGTYSLPPTFPERDDGSSAPLEIQENEELMNRLSSLERPVLPVHALQHLHPPTCGFLLPFSALLTISHDLSPSSFLDSACRPSG
jgi:hypothetical protein